MAERPRELLDYGELPQPPSRLFREYVVGTETVRPFFAGATWGRDELRSASRSGAGRDRAEVAAALAEQQRSRGAAQAAARAAELERPEAVAIVTGQQAGLFGGPLYVVYKAVAALRVAATLESETGRPVVPVFWVASDDHDFSEVRSTSLIDARGQLQSLRYRPQREPSGQPASEILLDDSIAALIAELGTMLGEAPHRLQVVEAVTSCYQPGVSISEAFGRLLSRLFPGLVVLEASDPAIKRQLVPVLRRELLESSPTSRLASETGQALVEAGFHQQVGVRQGFLNLFWVREGERRALAVENGMLEVRGLPLRLPVEAAALSLEADPAGWSPGALLRPLAQDHLLPTAAYVGGPAEIAYHAQIGPAYAHFGIPRPMLLPRPSLTLIEPALARTFRAEELSFRDLRVDPERILARWAREAHPEVDTAFERARGAVEAELGSVAEMLQRLDPTLQAAAEAARGRALHQLRTLEQKATRALKKRDQIRARRLRRLHDVLLPGGELQERGLGLVGWLARHGPELLRRIEQDLDPWARGHQLLHL